METIGSMKVFKAGGCLMLTQITTLRMLTGEANEPLSESDRARAASLLAAGDERP